MQNTTTHALTASHTEQKIAERAAAAGANAPNTALSLRKTDERSDNYFIRPLSLSLRLRLSLSKKRPATTRREEQEEERRERLPFGQRSLKQKDSK